MFQQKCFSMWTLWNSNKIVINARTQKEFFKLYRLEGTTYYGQNSVKHTKQNNVTPIYCIRLKTTLILVRCCFATLFLYKMHFDLHLKRAHYLITNEGHPAIVRPREMSDQRVPIINQFNRPPPFVLYPYENYTGTVAGRQLLIGLVPLHHDHLKVSSNVIYRLRSVPTGHWIIEDLTSRSSSLIKITTF